MPADRRTDGQTDRHDKGNSRFSQFCDAPKEANTTFVFRVFVVFVIECLYTCIGMPHINPVKPAVYCMVHQV